MAKLYFVVGGEYADTSFSVIAPGHSEERFGPFDEREAHICWRALTGKSVDNAMVRYFIRAGEDAAEETWYVVGGEYSDTTFQEIAPGRTKQVVGPFSRKEALDKWRELTGKTVDNALARFDLCTGEELKRQGL
ncbi:DUF4170 domain-containing protein [Paramagnetospirillum kuznetsovii]|uniref:DUF4170 domain-containing protein n=1 Tax=Paramagnetospirillum kuznetsovii TaxID=2053833 RepID=A0A364NZR2_9PROT|nr:DUF4170 domain-containing protein [Paramagnetospirillum kuznetsovii]RAU22579.1 DUF4170 domain-containing protein [Paramagnetospirillum kuznetsovii]